MRLTIMTGNTLYKLILTSIALMLCVCVHGQRVKERDPKRDRNHNTETAPEKDTFEDYVRTRERHALLSAKIDSMNFAVTEARKGLVNDSANKDYYTSEIIRLEEELISSREELRNISEELLRAELDNPELAQQYAGSERANTTVQAHITAAVNSSFYSIGDIALNTLNKQDYALYRSAVESEKSVSNDLARIINNYAELATLNAEYQKATAQPEADRLYDLIAALDSENTVLISALEAEWDGILDTKIYSYNYILDLSNAAESLAEMERKMSELQQKQLAQQGVYMYDAAAYYPLQRGILTEYEMKVANLYGLTNIVDSLSRSLKTFDSGRYLMPKLDLTERLFIDYENVEITRTPRYTTANPVPECVIYPKGVVYRILLGSYPRKQSVAVFKNITPLSWEQKGDSQYYYYAGGFAAFDEAEAALETVKKAGFAKAVVVVWQNGEYVSDNVSAIKDGGRQSGTQGSKGEYRIEITVKGGLPQSIRNIIAERAANKELTRSSGKQDGESVFIIGLFDSKVLVESISNEMSLAEPSADIKVTEIKL